MAGYQGAGRAELLHTNKQALLFDQELASVGSRSLAVQLERISHSSYPFGCSFQLKFTDVNGNPADPGAFEVDIQTSDTDAPNDYCTINTWNSAASLNANFVGRIELPQFWAKFVSGYITALANPVYVTLLVTH